MQYGVVQRSCIPNCLPRACLPCLPPAACPPPAAAAATKLWADLADQLVDPSRPGCFNQVHCSCADVARHNIMCLCIVVSRPPRCSCCSARAVAAGAGGGLGLELQSTAWSSSARSS